MGLMRRSQRRGGRHPEEVPTPSAGSSGRGTSTASSSQSQTNRGRRGRPVRGEAQSQRTKQERRETSSESEDSSSEEENHAVPASRGRGRPNRGTPASQTNGRKVATAGRGRRAAIESESSDEENVESRNIVPPEPEGISKDTHVKNIVLYLLYRQNKQTPFTRAEIVRDAMQKDKKQFKEVIHEVQKAMIDVFLMKLVGVEDGKHLSSTSDSFILVSTVPSAIYEDESRDDKVKNALCVILTIIYMGGAPLDADRLWAALVKLDLHLDICNERDHFEKFLKSEYVSKQYLCVREYTKTKNSSQESTYEWGLRSHYEFSKMSMLRNVAKRLNIRDLKSFSYAHGEAKKQMVQYGTVTRGAFEEREGDSFYSTTDDDTAPGVNEPSTSRGNSQGDEQAMDTSQEETQTLDF